MGAPPPYIYSCLKTCLLNIHIGWNTIFCRYTCSNRFYNLTDGKENSPEIPPRNGSSVQRKNRQTDPNPWILAAFYLTQYPVLWPSNCEEKIICTSFDSFYFLPLEVWFLRIDLSTKTKEHFIIERYLYDMKSLMDRFARIEKNYTFLLRKMTESEFSCLTRWKNSNLLSCWWTKRTNGRERKTKP